jgi:hypothetical protein
MSPNPLFDPVVWMVLGIMNTVFVAPAIAILLALDRFDKHMRRRKWARRRARGFEVVPNPNERTPKRCNRAGGN